MAIYFDYNLPVITNTVTTEIQVLAANEFEKSAIKFYPNPTSDRICFSDNNLKNKKYQMNDVSGKTVKSGRLTDDFITASQLEKGIYFLQVENRQTVKIIKE